MRIRYGSLRDRSVPYPGAALNGSNEPRRGLLGVGRVPHDERSGMDDVNVSPTAGDVNVRPALRPLSPPAFYTTVTSPCRGHSAPPCLCGSPKCVLAEPFPASSV